nr:cyclin-Y-like protein 2 isoform X2 [Saimiri boliviensis boliviensis]
MTLKSVALEIYYLIKKRDGNRTLEIFNEDIFPLYRDKIPGVRFMFDPAHKVIYRFMLTLFRVKRLEADLAIISLVYIKRLLEYADINICPTNWRRIVLGAILLAIDIWIDVTVDNKDLCGLFEKMTVDNMNELRRYFLELINANNYVPLSVYTRYYFYLRALAFRHGLSLPYHLLDRERAWDLEAFSRMEQEEVFYTARKMGSLSVDDLTRLQHTKAVLS